MTTCVLHPIETVPKALLEPLLDEEASMWATRLKWSFAPSRRRLEAALDEGIVNGFVARDDRGACAYATYSVDDDHGVIGSFFASDRARDRGLETLLVRRVLASLLASGPRLVDCQTLFSSDPGLTDPFADCGFESAARIFMTIDRPTWLGGQRAPLAPPLGSRPIHRTDLRSVAGLVYEAHRDTRGLDASSSFDTLDSCTKILRQIMLDEVCGSFDSAGSRRVEVNGEFLAISLMTWPLSGVAHVSEIATTPTYRRRGLARQCLAESLQSAFERSGATMATLSVTASNRNALSLYESTGFVPRIRYQSHVLRCDRR